MFTAELCQLFTYAEWVLLGPLQTQFLLVESSGLLQEVLGAGWFDDHVSLPKSNHYSLRVHELVEQINGESGAQENAPDRAELGKGLIKGAFVDFRFSDEEFGHGGVKEGVDDFVVSPLEMRGKLLFCRFRPFGWGGRQVDPSRDLL